MTRQEFESGKWCIRGSSNLDKYQRNVLRGNSNCGLHNSNYYYYPVKNSLNLLNVGYNKKYEIEFPEISYKQFINYLDGQFDEEDTEYIECLTKLLSKIK